MDPNGTCPTCHQKLHVEQSPDWKNLYRRMRECAAGYSNCGDETSTTMRRLDNEFEAIEKEARNGTHEETDRTKRAITLLEDFCKKYRYFEPRLALDLLRGVRNGTR